MGIYRVFAGSDGESHLEELLLEEHPALRALTISTRSGCNRLTGPDSWISTPCPNAG